MAKDTGELSCGIIAVMSILYKNECATEKVMKVTILHIEYSFSCIYNSFIMI